MMDESAVCRACVSTSPVCEGLSKMPICQFQKKHCIGAIVFFLSVTILDRIDKLLKIHFHSSI